MKITDYTWEIFDVAKANDVGIEVGCDMFIANMEHKTATYKGANQFNFEYLGSEWDKLTPQEKVEEKARYEILVRGYFKELTTARRENNKIEFERIVEKNIV